MNKKILITFIFVISFVSSTFLANPITPALSDNNNINTLSSSSSPVSTSGWTNINGTNISYRYGVDSFDANDSFLVTNNGTSHDSYTEKRVQDLTMDLVNLSSIVVQKYIYRITESVYVNATYNTTRTFVLDNNSYDTYVTQLNASFSNQLFIDYSAFNPTYGVTDTAIITTNNDYLGSFPTNETFYKANGPNNVNVTHIQEIIGILVSHTPIKNVQVKLNSTLTVDAYFGYYNAYQVNYTIHADQWSAQVRDGDRMGMYVSAFKDLQMNYTEVRASYLSYYIQSNYQVNLTYANGTYVPFENYPFALRPAFYQQNGTISDLSVRFINTTSVVASTSAVQAFHARLTKNLQNAHVDASSFVAWMVGSTPRLLAYKDVNLNNQLDLQFNPTDGLQQASGDYIPYIGMLEATSGNAITYQSTNQTYDQHIITLQGFELVNQTDKGITKNTTNWNQFHYGYGDTNYNFNNDFITYFDTPVNQSNTWVFKFGVEYRNFPVSWVNMTDGQATLDPMNISYDYVYSINPYLGTAKLSPTITYGSVTNSTLKTAFNRLSLATMYESDFLSVATLRATRLEQTSQNVTSSLTTNFAEVSFAGPQNFTTVDTRGGKQYYTLDGVTHTTNASVMNLASFSAAAASENVTVFQSDNQNIIGSAMMKNTTITGVKLNYRKDLILISYPQWNGGKIVHDPTFSTVYAPESYSPQIVSSSGDSSVTSGTGLVLQWQVQDKNNDGATYVIKDESGTVVQQGTWQSGETIQLAVTPTVGTHSYTLTVTDSAGNTDSKTIQVTVTKASNTTPTTTTVPISTQPSKTSSAPGFTLETVVFLSIISLGVMFKKRVRRS